MKRTRHVRYKDDYRFFYYASTLPPTQMFIWLVTQSSPPSDNPPLSFVGKERVTKLKESLRGWLAST